MKLTLIGTGIKGGDMSLSAYEAAKNADKVLIRTALTESGKWAVQTFAGAIALDFVYEKSRTFDTLCKNLAKTVLKEAEDKDVVYLVDGAVSEDRSCKEILKKRKDAIVVNGISRAAAYCAVIPELGVGLACVSAYDMPEKIGFSPCAVYDVDGEMTAGKVKLSLMNEFGDEAEAYFFSGGKHERIKLYELDRKGPFDYSCAVVVPKQKLTEKTRFCFDDLVEILRILRSENGCPWDKAQTKESVRKDLIEESYELLDAIDKSDDDAICEETGDLILQAVFQCVFAEERGAFCSDDVISGICNKLISRHTHVFGEDAAANASAALEVWANNKEKEKGFNSAAEYLESVPDNFPALLRAEKVGNRSKKYNMDFLNEKQALEKVYEEINEVIKELDGDKKNINEECGDLLFAVTSFVRLCGVENELALKSATEKFLKRFRRAEELARKDGKEFKDLSFEETDFYYDAAKKG